ncbi:MAG: acyl-CoA dehydrogenase family protein [Proteobacteria bacterium]|nr:acyl-CoA dehydrogenase family protein [Pseudomonadota bacterium]
MRWIPELIAAKGRLVFRDDVGELGAVVMVALSSRNEVAPQIVTSPLERARELGTTIRATADEIEKTRRIPEPLLGRLFETKLFRLLLPRVFGGEECKPSDYFRAVAEVARHDASVGWNMFVANSSVTIAPHIPAETAHRIYADPRALIAWGPPNACRAKAVEGGYRVTGEWSFASGCRQANWMGVHAHVEEADGSLRLNRAGKPTVRTLLMPLSQATLLDTWHTIGLKGTASDTYRVEDVFVAEAFSGTREDPEGRRVPGPLYAFTMQGLYATGVAGVAVGIAREMTAELVALAQKKVPRSQQRLADQPMVQSLVGTCEARLGAAEAYMIATLDEQYARADAWAVMGTGDRAQVRLACTNAIHAGIEVCDSVYKAAGVDAIFPGSPFERRFRDMHTLSQQIQSRSSHFEAVGRILLGAEDPAFM